MRARRCTSFPDADVICDVGGCDVKIMMLRGGAVTDFRLNSQCSSGNGAFLQGVAERYDVPLGDYAERAFQAERDAQPRHGLRRVPAVRHRQPAAQGLVGGGDHGRRLAACCRSMSGSMPASCNNLRAVGRKFVLQGGTHRNLAVVKAQVDFITAKVPDAEIVIHPLFRRGRRDRRGAVRSTEPGAQEAAAASAASTRSSRSPIAAPPASTRSAAGALSTASAPSSTSRCRAAKGSSLEQGAAGAGWERVISGNSCPKGLVEDAERIAGGEGPNGGGEACLSQRGRNGSRQGIPTCRERAKAAV